MDQEGEFKPGEVIAERYQIVRRLGFGGMAEAYEVSDLQGPKKVALKIVRAEYAHNAQLQARFQHEFSILKDLAHPNIVQVFECSETGDGRAFFTLELLNGKTLESLIRENPLSVNETRAILIQVAEALSFLHTHHLVYCDLKPANIIVSKSPNGANALSCTLIDFGIAQRVQKEHTAQQNITGTSHYLSPEQVRGIPLDNRSDIYAFGVLGYELMTGKPPFIQQELFSATASHLIGKVAPLRESRSDVPKGLSTLLHLCLAKDPDDRYQSMNEVLERLTAPEEQGFLQKLLAHWQRIITIPARAQRRKSDPDTVDTPLNAESKRPNSHPLQQQTPPAE